MKEYKYKQYNCPHMEKLVGEPPPFNELHWFEWPSDPENSLFPGRNIWNPFQPVCKGCGISIGELVKAYLDLINR